MTRMVLSLSKLKADRPVFHSTLDPYDKPNLRFAIGGPLTHDITTESS